MKKYDLIIIWTWWWTKLTKATSIWKKVAIIEKENLWWTCLNKWCIPSKMLIYPADLLTHIKEDAKKLNINLEWKISINFEKLIKETTETVKKESNSIKPKYEKNPNLDLYEWNARFIEDKIIEINWEKITATNIYIVTWSKPQIPNIPWLESTPYFTSKEALRNTKKPKKMIVIWGGYIAVELGHFYWAVWTDIHFLVRSEMIKNEDKDIREVFQKDFWKRYNLHFWVSPSKVEYIDDIFKVTLVDEQWNESILEWDALFVATWVIPNTEDLWLENTNIKVSSKWFIEVDSFLETNIKWVYSMWDVVWNYLFRHSVNFEWEYLFSQHFKWEKKEPIKYPPMPHAIFTYPQIAWVWVTEDELIKQGKKIWEDYLVWINNYEDSAMWMASKTKVGMVKLIADKNTGRLIWAHIIWEKASDIIHMLIVYVSQWLKIENMIKDMIFIHPALSENIRNAARKIFNN